MLLNCFLLECRSENRISKTESLFAGCLSLKQIDRFTTSVDLFSVLPVPVLAVAVALGTHSICYAIVNRCNRNSNKRFHWIRCLPRARSRHTIRIVLAFW